MRPMFSIAGARHVPNWLTLLQPPAYKSCSTGSAVKHWKEAAEVFGRIVAAAQGGRRAALATVVRIQGSAYRRPGARFLIEEGGLTSGSVSGGCLEADVRETALEVMRAGAPRLLHYDTSTDDRTVWGLGLGCNGSVDIFVQPATEGEPLEIAQRALDLLAGESPFVLSTVLQGPASGRAMLSDAEGIVAGSTGLSDLDRAVARQGMDVLSSGESRLHELQAWEVFSEHLAPPPNLIVFGAGDDAIPLCRYASDAGFRVTVVDHRQAYLSPERFPDAAGLQLRRSEEGLASLPVGPRAFAVVKTHSFAEDREWARQLVASNLPYVGLLGPRARAAEIRSQIGAKENGRVYAPVGLDLGAEGPEQVALAIVAELLAVRSSREPWPLREKEGAIHAG
jgi:xanthine dehydrogenase accessory factor